MTYEQTFCFTNKEGQLVTLGPKHGHFALTFQNNWVINISSFDRATSKAKVSIADSRDYSECDIYYWTDESHRIWSSKHLTIIQ